MILMIKVLSVSHGAYGEGTTKFINDVNRRIFELIHSSDMNDKIGGILAIGKKENQ